MTAHHRHICSAGVGRLTAANSVTDDCFSQGIIHNWELKPTKKSCYTYNVNLYIYMCVTVHPSIHLYDICTTVYFGKGIFITHDPITLQLNSKGPIRCTMHNNFVFVPENTNSSSKWGAFLVSLLSLLALWVVWLSGSFSTGLITFLHSSRLNRDAVTSCEQLKPNKTTLRHKQRKKTGREDE